LKGISFHISDIILNSESLVTQIFLLDRPTDQQQLYNPVNDTLNRTKNLEYRVNAIFLVLQ